MNSVINLNRFILAREKQHPAASGELSDLLSTIALGVKIISHMVSSAAFQGLYGKTGEKNVHGEQVQILDQQSHKVMEELLSSSGHFGLMVSEERDTVIPVNTDSGTSKYVVAFDPLDGSSNLGMNVAVGTIFTIFRKKNPGKAATLEDFFQTGRAIVAAGYVVYGPSTVLVYSSGAGVHEFTLDPTLGEFMLTGEALRMPERGSTYSINEGNSVHWDEKITRFIQRVKSEDKTIGAPYSARYIGSLVSDFHRTLRKGGIFLYPADKKNPRGKLRLLYECMPIAYIAEQAGGFSSDGTQSVLDIVPHDIHERAPLIVGSTGCAGLLSL
jgi:fructose-1,6-bisphosphatase I